jgi:glyoxylate reductase
VSGRPQLLVTRRIPASVVERLCAHVAVDLHDVPGDLPRDELLRRVAGKQALMSVLTDAVDAELLDAGRDLRIVANIAVGYDNVDVAAAAARGIHVTNTPEVLTEAVADFTMALILAVTRRVGEGERLVRSGRWKGWALDFMLGMELRDKQLGIVGYGRIGQAVARRAAAFGMRIAYADTAAGAVAAPVEGAGPRGASAVLPASRLSLDELLVSSDVVSLHLGSATRETRTAMADLAARNVIAVLNGEPPLTPVVS